MSSLKKPQNQSLGDIYSYAVFALSRHRYLCSLHSDIVPVPHDWQRDIVESTAKRKLVNGARQSGKSAVISVVPCHGARFFPKSLHIIIAPNEKQAGEDMGKVKSFIAHDNAYPEIVRYSESEIELVNGSRIIIVPATETAARGYSKPRTIILDEASRIPDIVYKSGVIPMLTNNPDCELIAISTPNGKGGFFYKAMQNALWERYEVRSPWDVSEDGWGLVEAIAEAEYVAKMKARNVKAYYSPQHFDLKEQMFNLGEMGRDMYKQEYCCEFVEPNEQAFSYSEIEHMFKNTIKPLDFSVPDAEPLDISGFGNNLSFGYGKI